LLADDDGAQIIALSLEAQAAGRVTGRQSTTGLFEVPEGIERFGGALALVGNNRLLVADARSRAPRKGFPVQYALEGYGSHIAGVGWDGKELLLTASAYTQASQQNDRSLLLAVNPATGDITRAWHLGDYSSDPRGVAVRDRLVYVVDGYHSPTLPDGKEPNRLGLKLFVFALSPVTRPQEYTAHMPLRRQE
jgi:hypothetical protein